MNSTMLDLLILGCPGCDSTRPAKDLARRILCEDLPWRNLALVAMMRTMNDEWKDDQSITTLIYLGYATSKVAFRYPIFHLL